ncbi:hypothetical protein [Streptomyces sp. MST-110588]|uniref:hypothetical protein n=1 Tax=Streptomyces sp. MST-110588 TaxID=2833628 RepID=UPI001F5C35B1|nr:hypothetical protein [Streptomyces sp. MST-110588]UNO41635.1 hypothetical protein KGS77_21400 [Streptomyces sp. MST-110588]
MLDVMPLQTAVDALADRLRVLPQSVLSRGAAAEGLALARDLAARAQRIESPEREPHAFPDAGMFAVGDQVAVAGHDLVEALRTAGNGPEAVAELAEALELVRDTVKRC